MYQKYESEAEAAHGRKQERWGEANDLVSQMGQTETTKFSSMQEKCVPLLPPLTCACPFICLTAVKYVLDVCRKVLLQMVWVCAC